MMLEGANPLNALFTSKADRKVQFASRPPLPLESPGGSPAMLVDQHRLAGAFFITLEHIRPDPQQPRKTLDPKKQRELKDSVRRLGILQPISVRYVANEETYLIIAGERRFLAAQAAGLAEVPCWVQRLKDNEILVHQIVENWQRADLHPFDLADALALLRDGNGYTQKQ